MAENNEHSKMASSFTTGSDEAFEFVCKPCERDNQNVEGVGYCVDCVEYLCGTCYSCHKKIQVLRDHALLDKDNMPKHTSRIPPALPPKPKKRNAITPQAVYPKPKPGDNFTSKCPKHDSEFTKFYCNEHHKLACSVCLPMDHRICKDVSYIPEVSDRIVESKGFQQVLNELKRLQAVLGFEYSRALYNKKRIDEIHKTALEDILEFKDEIVRIIDNIYKETEQEVNSIRDSQLANLTTWIKRYNALTPDVEKIVRNFEANISKVNCNQLFIDMKIAKEEMSNLQDKVRRISDQNKVSQYKFEGYVDIVEKLTAVKNLGKILNKKKPVIVRATLLSELNANSDKDTVDCDINGAVILPNGDLALSDHHNKSVKIVFPRENKVKSQIFLQSQPFDLTLVKGDQLAATLPCDFEIQLLQISGDVLTKVKSFPTLEMCTGIEFHDDKLIAVCQKEPPNPGCVLIMDMDGRLMKRLDTDRFGKSLFLMPRSVALSMDKSVIYVTEWDTDQVKVVTLDGEPVAEYQSVGAKPLGIAFDNEGGVFLTCGDSHELHQLSPTCSRIQILLNKIDGLFSPWAVALDRHKDLLYVGIMTKSMVRNKLSVFQLSYEWV